MAPTRNEAAVRAAVYARLSRDDEDDRLAVKRQERDCRALCAAKGWEVAETFTDNDLSAWSGKKRPRYLAMLGAIQRGEVNAVVAYHLDRLTRTPRELEDFFTTCDEAGVRRFATCSGDVDLGAPDGQFSARILGAVAKKSSDDTSRRLRRKFEEVAASGQPHGGRRPFAFEDDRITVRRPEAKIYKELTRRVLRGESLTGLAKELNERMVPNAMGGQRWTATTLKILLVNPRYAGLRAHRGEVVGPASWPAVISKVDHQRLVAVLQDPSRRRKHPGRSLLVGLVKCGLCGESMTSDSAASGRRILRCRKGPGRPNCGRVSIKADDAEQVVVEALFDAVESKALIKRLAAQQCNRGRDSRDLVRLIADDEVALETLAKDYYADARITRTEFFVAREAVEGRLEENRKALTREVADYSLGAAGFDLGRTRKAWPKMSLDQRRAVLRTVFDRVEVGPAEQRHSFAPDRLTLVFTC